MVRIPGLGVTHSIGMYKLAQYVAKQFLVCLVTGIDGHEMTLMTNDEVQMTKEARMTNDKGRI